MHQAQSAFLLLTLSVGLSMAVDICEHQMNGVRLAHPADCSKFVVCENGVTDSIMNCPIGLHFNRFKGVCDIRERAACDIQYLNLISEATDCSGCCALYGCILNPNCPVTSDTPATLATPETPATPATPETPATPATPETPECPDTPATPGTPGTPGTPATPATPATPETPATPATPSTPATNNCSNNSTICIGKPSGSVTYVNGTCNQYIVCVAGCANIMDCPNNLQYNLSRHICDYPENVDCPWQSTPPTTGPSGITCAQPGICAGQPQGKMFADSKSNGYIVCQCECEIERPCPAGTKFNETLLTCAHDNKDGNESGNENGSGSGNDGSGSENGNGNGSGSENGNGNDSGSGNDNGSGSGNGNGSDNGNNNGNETIANVVCTNSVQICKNETEGSLFPVDGVCNKFYICNYGCAVETLCPNNLVYNPTADICDYPQNYKCPWPYTPPAGPAAGPSGIACPSGGRCVGQNEGTFFPSLTSCSKYVVCQCECEVEMNCANGLQWDKKLQTCNYAANVTCDLA